MITLYEILPNPVGADSRNEWIKIYNSSGQDVNLFSWRIKDASGKTFVFQQKEIGSNSFLTIPSKQTKIALNNNGDSLFLYDQNNNLIDRASYDFVVSEGTVLSRKDNLFVLGQNPILKENQSPSKQTDKAQFTSQANALSHKPLTENLMIGVTIVFVLSLIFVIIIKKLSLLNED